MVQFMCLYIGLMFQYDQGAQNASHPVQRVCHPRFRFGRLTETTASSGRLTLRPGTPLRLAARLKMLTWHQSPLTPSANMWRKE